VLAFTLIEVVFAITIIAILLSILLPAMSSIKLSAQKVKDVSNLQKIAEAWRECAINRDWVIDGKCGSQYRISFFAEQLAGTGKTNPSDMVLNDPYVYISPGDKYACKVRYETITRFNGSEVTWTSAFPDAANFLVSSGPMMSYCVVMNLPAYAPLDTTPFGFIRGLREDGKWDEKIGLYGSKGGYVVYCDGHVVWFDGNNPAKFLKWDKSGYTSDIRQTVPNSAFITCINDGIATDYKSDGKLVILYSQGMGGS
jgi:type II secretory pathway pseudopilin PulG